MSLTWEVKSSLFLLGCILDDPESQSCGAVICVSIVCGLILLCVLRRLVQHYYPNALLIYPVAPRMQRRSPGELPLFMDALPQSHELPAGVYSGNKTVNG